MSNPVPPRLVPPDTEPCAEFPFVRWACAERPKHCRDCCMPVCQFDVPPEGPKEIA